ncbi:hypothetical protein LCM10_03435 [Rossellomorea aquimaris]|uniref:hypothetical protein n=1 Tax=Rossellomorea aquimaris TaxID=189382 RepID=UPI001CD7C911|nr:hypothetical protein [Rossellomorea aquimaris]MCA1054029.1 hypothetical protein [Rossellomorea aquimaris]
MNIVKPKIILMTTAFFISACQSTTDEQIDIKLKTEEEQQEITNSYNYEDYKNLFDEAVAKADNLAKDESLHKWVVRMLPRSHYRMKQS